MDRTFSVLSYIKKISGSIPFCRALYRFVLVFAALFCLLPYAPMPLYPELLLVYCIFCEVMLYIPGLLRNGTAPTDSFRRYADESGSPLHREKTEGSSAASENDSAVTFILLLLLSALFAFFLRRTGLFAVPLLGFLLFAASHVIEPNAYLRRAATGLLLVCLYFNLRDYYSGTPVGTLAAQEAGGLSELVLSSPALLARLTLPSVIMLILLELVTLIRTHRSHWSLTVPYFLLLMTAVTLMPWKDKPLDATFLLDFGRGIIRTAEDISLTLRWHISGLSFGESSLSGYSGLGHVGRVSYNNDREDLYVDVRDQTSPLALTGSAHMNFNGQAWSGRVMDSFPKIEQTGHNTGIAETLPYNSWFAVWLSALMENEITPEEAACFSEVRKVDVTFGSIRTRDLLHMGTVLAISSEAKDELSDNAADYNLKRPKGRGFSYSLTYMDIDTANPYLLSVLRGGARPEDLSGTDALSGGEAQPEDLSGRDALSGGEAQPGQAVSLRGNALPDYERLSAYCEELYGVPLRTWIVPSAYEEIRQFYGEFSEKEILYDTQQGVINRNVSDSNDGALLQDGTMDSVLNGIMDSILYDAQYNMPHALLKNTFISKRTRSLARAVTEGCTNDYDRCLRIEAYLRQFPYDREPDSLSAGTEDIVDAFLFSVQQGYCVHFASAMTVMLRAVGIPARYCEGYTVTFDEKGEDGWIVRGGDAHAWPEAWISGYGWVKFEPTPTKQTAAETGWGRLVATEAGEDSHASESITAGTGSLPAPELLPTPAPDEEILTDTAPGISSPVRRLMLLLGTAILLTPVLLLLFSVTHKRVRYRRAMPEKKLEYLVGDLAYLLSVVLHEENSRLPLLYLASRLSSENPDIGISLQASCESVFMTWYRLRFGKNSAIDAGNLSEELMEEEITRAEALVSTLVNNAVQNINKKSSGRPWTTALEQILRGFHIHRQLRTPIKHPF